MFSHEKWPVWMHCTLNSSHISHKEFKTILTGWILLCLFLLFPTSYHYKCNVYLALVELQWLKWMSSFWSIMRQLFFSQTGGSIIQVYWSTSCLNRERSPNVLNTTHRRSKGPKLFTLADATESLQWVVEKYQAMPGRSRRKPLLLLMPCFRPHRNYPEFT